jgi:predicted AlkP superfamily phosphohydrolase/phosphomutase
MSKLVVIGIDGATPDLMFPWMDQGMLPNFQKIREGGVWGRLNSVPNQRSAAAWSSFATGTNPGKHGFLNSMSESLELIKSVSPVFSKDGISFGSICRKRGRRRLW